jgi:cytochrome c-type biogenesis protein CcsB
MRGLLAALCIAAFGTSPLGAGDIDWSLWRDLPVQSGGRNKPLDTFSGETLRLIANRSSVTDPETGARLSPTALYLAMMLDWQGWSHPDHGRLLLASDWRTQYFQMHPADKWDRTPLLRVDYLELRSRLALQPDRQHVAPADLAEASIDDPRSGASVPFTTWANQLLRLEDEGKKLSTLEQKGLELANRLWSYQNHRMGRELEILPIAGSTTKDWISVAHLLLTPFDNDNDPAGHYRYVQDLLRQAWQAYRQDDAEALNRIAAALKDAVRLRGPELGEYPTSGQMDLEIAFNDWVPFRYAWILMLASALAMLLCLGSGWRFLLAGAWIAYGLGLAAMIAGFAMRIAIAGRPPVTNMYESVVYVGFGAAAFGFILELIYRKRFILMAGTAISTLALILADNCPTVLDPSLRPLEPVLRSNFWLVVHVMTITLSYAAFALALGIANITLGYFLVRSDNVAAIAALSRFTYKALQIGVLLLAAGTILGGVWADYSWGRFWGWDPKEVWALVALLGYLSVLHARHIGWVGHRGLAAMSVVCFTLVVMAWYGVNFVLGAGLHSYGFGGGGQGWVYSVIVLQLLYAGAACRLSGSTAMSKPLSNLRGRPAEPVGVSVGRSDDVHFHSVLSDVESLP